MSIYKISTHGHVQNIGQNPQKPFLDISSFWNIYKGNILQKFQENSSKSHMHNMMTLQSLNSIQIVLDHISPPKSSLSRYTFEQLYIVNFLFFSQTLWAHSNTQIMTLDQVVHQGEEISLARSKQIHFCWFLGFTKVALATFSIWPKSLWALLILMPLTPVKSQSKLSKLASPNHHRTPSRRISKWLFQTLPLISMSWYLYHNMS